MKQVCGVSLAILAMMAGCSSMHGDHHGGADYCAQYRETMADSSLDEQRKVAEAHIVRMHGSADEAHVARHLRMMEQRCGSASPPRRGG